MSVTMAEAPIRSLPTVIFSMAWRSYLHKLHTDPLLTKSVTSAVLSVCSDLFARSVTKTPLRSSAAVNELTIGLVLRGPVIHAFHNFLDGVLFKGRRQTSAWVVLSKLAIDQLVFAPIFTSLYFYARALAEDRSFATTTTKLRTELGAIMRSNWSVWVPANLLNYWLVPVELRVLFGSVVGLFWNAYLISRAAGADAGAEADADANVPVVADVVSNADVGAGMDVGADAGTGADG